jgi:ligand-binding sensor domain-containing protein/signal transduction histidine kinase
MGTATAVHRCCTQRKHPAKLCCVRAPTAQFKATERARESVRHITKTIIAAQLLCICATLTITTARALAPDRSVAQYGHSAWRTENGLPQNTVRAILQTRDGYIWLATDEGLVRFDGLSFAVFDKQNTVEIKSNNIQVLYEDGQANLWVGTDAGLVQLKDRKFTAYSSKDGLCHDRIISICEDSRGNLWIGTPGGLNRFRDGRFTGYTINQGLPSNSVGIIYEDHDGNLWVSTTGGLARLNREGLTTYTTRDGLPAASVSAIYQSRNGDLWLGTSGGLALFKDGKFITYTTREGLANNMVWSIQEDSQGNLWVGTDGGLCSLRGGRFITYTTKHGLPADSILTMHQDRDGNLWLGTPGGLARFKDGKLAAYTTKEGLSNNVVLAIYEDIEGNLWVGTEAGGLNLLKDTNFITYTTRDGLSDDYVWSVCQGSNGQIWIGTQAGGLNRFKDGKFTAYGVRDGLPSDTVRALCEDRDGALWIGTPKGLAKLKNGRFTIYTVQDGLSSNAVWSIHQDKSGQLWIGTLGGLTRFSNGRFDVYTTSDGLPDDAVLAIQSSSDGSLWIGTRNGGLSRLKDGRFTNYTTDDGLSDNSVRAIYEDRDGTLWIGTRRGGLNRFKQGRFTAFTTKEGLFDDCVFQILEDEKGNLWMSSTKGVFRASRQELNDFADGRTRFISSVHYGTSDGMQNRECNGGQPAGCRSADGKLWFPTMKGVAVIDAEKIKINQVPPPVSIERVSVDNESYDPTKRAELPASTSRLEFQYVGLSFAAPEKVRFKYMLEGFDKEWIDAGTKRAASYTNIPPGSYRFRVLACNNDGVWSEASASFDFYLKPHFYQTYWFYLLMAAAAVLIGWAVYRLRIRQVQSQFSAVLAERNRMAREIHDTLAQGFVGIGLQLEAIEKALDEFPQLARQHLKLAQSMVSHSLAEASRTVWNLRSKSLESGDLVTALSETAKKLTEGTATQVEIQVDGTPRRLAKPVEDNLLRIGQEALSNAMKHARPKRIHIKLSFESDQVHLCVRDDGCGFDIESRSPLQDGHFGLIGMRERAKQIKGHLTIESRPGEGTEINITVPLGWQAMGLR